MAASTNTKRTGKIGGAGPSTASKVESIGIDEFVKNLDPNRETFYVKKGRPYRGVYFTLDFMVPFTEADCINKVVTDGLKINLQNLEQIFKKCKNVENLKFYGVTITESLIELIADNCPNLKNLELNPSDCSYDKFEDDRNDIDVIKLLKDKCKLSDDTDDVDVIKLLFEKCKELENIIIRNLPTGNLESKCDWDKVDNNFFFRTQNSVYDINCFAHQNINRK